MSKPAAIFVAAAMAVTAGCVAVIASHGLGLDLGAALLAGLAALAGMAVTHLAFLRAAPREDGRLDEIDGFVSELHARLETVELRLSTIDGAGAERARAATRPLVEEIAALGGLVTTVAKEVAAHDVALARLRAAKTEDVPPSAVAAPTSSPPVASPPVASPPVISPPLAAPAPMAASVQRRAEAPSDGAAPPKIAPPEPFDPDAEDASGVFDLGLGSRIDRALAENRIEAHLQPIVALPSRRTAHYEAFSRLAEADGLLAAADFLGEAAACGKLAEIDRRTIERCAAVALRLSARGGGAVFCNLGASTLTDAAALGALDALFERQAELRRLIVLEMAQAAAASLGGAERAALDAFTASGVRLSLDRVEDLGLDPRELSRRGVRFVKVAAARLLDPAAVKGASIHPADLSSLLARHGVDLIATHVEEERTVPELLDMEVRFAQGHLFGVPRPARPAAPDPRPAVAAAPTTAARLVPRSVGAR